MSYKNILKDIQEKKIKSLYLLYGSEDYIIEKIIKKLENSYIDINNKDFNYTSIDGDKISVDSLIDTCETVPFMGAKRIVVVKEWGCFSTKKSTINSDDEEKLVKYFSNIPTFTCLVFVEGNNIDKRKKVVKEIKKYGELIEITKLDKKDLVNWIKKKFQENNKAMSTKFIEDFISITGYEDKNSDSTLHNLENEISKICNYMGDKDHIDSNTLEIILNKSVENNIFILVDAVAEKNGAVALKILSRLLTTGEPEIRILHMIIRQFRLLNLTKLMLDKGYTTMAISPKLSLPQYIVKKYVRQSNSFSSNEILKILNVALETDRKIKTGEINPKLGIEILIGQCCII